MAESTAITSANDLLISVSATAPTAAGDPADAVYKIVDLQDEHSTNLTRETTEVRTKTASAETVGAGIENMTISGVRSLEAADGQDILFTAARAAEAPLLYIIEYPRGLVGKARYGTGKVSSLQTGNGSDAPSFTCEIKLTAPLTEVTLS